MTELSTEIEARLGTLPNFFANVDNAPETVKQLWAFTRSAYLDNPMPSIFKERLFVHLSRFCSARYCIVRHVGFLVGLGYPSGDPTARPQTIGDVVKLLSRPATPCPEDLQESLARMLSIDAPRPLPSPDTDEEADVLAACGVMFLHPAQSEQACRALRKAVGDTSLDLLTALIAFIRTTHFWHETHPNMPFEDDLENLLRSHQDLAGLLLDQTEGARTELGQRLYEELILLRGERDDRVALRQALAEREQSQRRQAILIHELNHRVKNTLSIIQSIARQTLRGEDVSPQARAAFMARLLALADAHDILTAESWESADLGAVVAKTFAFLTDPGRVSVEGPRLRLDPKAAVTISMAFHELATNAVNYGALSNAAGKIEVTWTVDVEEEDQMLRLTWKEAGGPVVVPPARRGFGSRLIERGLAGELGGTATLAYEPDGLRCTVLAPMKMTGNNP